MLLRTASSNSSTERLLTNKSLWVFKRGSFKDLGENIYHMEIGSMAIHSHEKSLVYHHPWPQIATLELGSCTIYFHYGLRKLK